MWATKSNKHWEIFLLHFPQQHNNGQLSTVRLLGNIWKWGRNFKYGTLHNWSGKKWTAPMIWRRHILSHRKICVKYGCIEKPSHLFYNVTLMCKHDIYHCAQDLAMTLQSLRLLGVRLLVASCFLLTWNLLLVRCWSCASHSSTNRFLISVKLWSLRLVE